MIQTIDEAVKFLVSYIPKAGQMAGNYKLDRMRRLMDLVDNPQNSYEVIHVAGTSGKTSTAYFIQGLLQAAGKKTGLTVSPHIQSITERIQVNGQPISDELFVKYLNDLLRILEQTDITPTYFELLVMLAYFVFKQEKVDYAVIETGLGGLLDGTNVVTNPNKVCVITDIGLDHVDILGKTLPEIALQKTGIVQPKNTLILQQQTVGLEEIMKDEALRRGASTILVVPSPTHLPELPSFQRRNWMAATTAYRYVAVRDGLSQIDEFDVHDAMMHQPPGRMEQFKVGNKTVILDGAHNQQKLQALIEALSERQLVPLNVLASFVSDKRYQLEECLQELRPVTSQLVVTDFSVLQDLSKTAASVDDIAAVARAQGFSTVATIEHPDKALDYILSLPGETVLITGSLYLAAQLRQQLSSL